MLKAKFLKNESENLGGLVRRENQIYFPNLDFYPQFHTQECYFGVLINGIEIRVTPACYDKLKAKFRTFKKKVKDKNKVKKQYYFDKETANFLSRFKEKNYYNREEVVIEYLVKKHEKQKLDSEHLDKLDKSANRIKFLKNELADCKEQCSTTENYRMLLKVRINELEDLLARADLLNKFLKETLEEHNIKFSRPLINDDDVERYKAEN